MLFISAVFANPFTPLDLSCTSKTCTSGDLTFDAKLLRCTWGDDVTVRPSAFETLTAIEMPGEDRLLHTFAGSFTTPSREGSSARAAGCDVFLHVTASGVTRLITEDATMWRARGGAIWASADRFWVVDVDGDGRPDIGRITEQVHFGCVTCTAPTSVTPKKPETPHKMGTLEQGAPAWFLSSEDWATPRIARFRSNALEVPRPSIVKRSTTYVMERLNHD